MGSVESYVHVHEMGFEVRFGTEERASKILERIWASLLSIAFAGNLKEPYRLADIPSLCLNVIGLLER